MHRSHTWFSATGPIAIPIDLGSTKRGTAGNEETQAVVPGLEFVWENECISIEWVPNLALGY